MKIQAVFCLVVNVVLASLCGAQESGTRLLRFPDIHGDKVAFSYGGDLWEAPVSGGTARRLTAHPGQELFPRFSPDGEWIAFTGQYDGDEQVYVIPATGGEPVRLTWYPAVGPLPPRWGYDNQVYGWTPDGEKVLFRSLRDAGGITDSRLYTVPRSGGLPSALPMPTSGAGDFSPDGMRMVYSPLFRDFRHWKRYQGGWAQDLYIFDLATDDVTPLAHSRRTERDPMWIGDTIFFVSDRDDHLNLYSADPTTGAVEQLTFSKVWDVRWPSSDGQHRIVYELDGQLHVYDVASKDDRAIVITVPDDGLWKRPRHISVAGMVSSFGLSPEGKRAVFSARGEIFSVPAEKGPTRNLTRSSGANDRSAAWSPDGSQIAYISDAGGEDEVWLVDQEGKAPARKLTSGHATQLSEPRWSPDGKRIAFSDHVGRLFVADVADGKDVLIADDVQGRVGDYAWSPRGGHLAFSLANQAGIERLHIWSVADGKLRQITSDAFDAYSPAWGVGGDYLYYLSDRHYAPQISDLEWNFAGNQRGGIYAMALRKNVKPLFPPQSDEVVTKADSEKGATKDETTSKKKDSKSGAKEEKSEGDGGIDKGPIEIDFDGLSARAMPVPVGPDNYIGLFAVEGHLVYATTGPAFYGRSDRSSRKLSVFSLEDREATVVVSSNLEDAAISADGKKMLVRAGGGFKLYDVKPKPGEPDEVSTGGLEMDLVPAEEWALIFDQAWRLFRDYFYVENMNGYDWQAIGDRYRTQLKYVAHRSDLNYVLSEMVAELNSGHTYISGGDFEIPDRAPVGLPGARLELDAEAGRYRIAEIYPGQNEEERYRSPLTEVGVDISAGDYVLAINGRDLTGDDNPYRLLQFATDPVTLTVNSTAVVEGAREVSYVPIRDEQPLRYLSWVLGNHDRVTRISGGRVGYLHIPDMGAEGIAEFIKWFYPQIRKEGLVIDVRSNGGGNVSQWIIERLDTRVLGTRFGRTVDYPLTYPNTAFFGHMACVLNETSASDGDIFPYYFREAGLGPLIGKRSWGGVVGGGQIPLVDGGSVFVPRMATNDVKGNYIIEGIGVEPDIEVENSPKSLIEGRDPQLERAVEEVLAAIQREPRQLPTRPPDPVKTPGH